MKLPKPISAILFIAFMLLSGCGHYKHGHMPPGHDPSGPGNSENAPGHNK